MDYVLIIDDHALVRQGLRALLEQSFPSCKFEEAASLKEAMHFLSNPVALDLDMVMLDLDLPDAKQLEGLAELRHRFPMIPVAIISASKDAALARAALAAGASGFISKSQTPDVLVAALTCIRDGSTYAAPDLLIQDPAEADILNKLKTLTPQQRMVLRMIVQGHLNKQIAHELSISLTTVKAHVSAALLKLEVTNRTQAALLVKRFHLLP